LSSAYTDKSDRACNATTAAGGGPDDEPDDEPIKVQIPVTVLRLARAARSKQSLDSGSAALSG